LVGKGSTIFTLRMQPEMIEEITTFVENGRFASTGEAIRETCKIGMKVIYYQDMMSDPKRANEFQQKMREIIENDKLTDWASTLTDDQIAGFMLLLQAEKEGRYKMERFR